MRCTLSFLMIYEVRKQNESFIQGQISVSNHFWINFET